MQSKYGFIYIWRDSKKGRPNRFYIGSHWGREDDGYICSSNWMRMSFKRHPETFKRRILKIITTNRLDLYKEEDYWLNFIKNEELGKKYYNFNTKSYFNVWWLDPERAKTTKERMSKSKIGHITSEETKKKMSEANKGKPKSEEHKRKMSEYRLGRKFSEETKKKMSKSHKGQSNRIGMHHSEESKRKISESLRAKNKRRLEII